MVHTVGDRDFKASVFNGETLALRLRHARAAVLLRSRGIDLEYAAVEHGREEKFRGIVVLIAHPACRHQTRAVREPNFGTFREVAVVNQEPSSVAGSAGSVRLRGAERGIVSGEDGGIDPPDDYTVVPRAFNH